MPAEGEAWAAQHQQWGTYEYHPWTALQGLSDLPETAVMPMSSARGCAALRRAAAPEAARLGAPAAAETGKKRLRLVHSRPE